MLANGGPEADSLPKLVTRVIDDANAVGRAELAVFRAKTQLRIGAYRNAAILFAAAAVLALCALVALFVGAILALATLIGPGWATLAVVLGVFAAAGLLGWLGARQANVTRRLESGSD